MLLALLDVVVRILSETLLFRPSACGTGGPAAGWVLQPSQPRFLARGFQPAAAVGADPMGPLARPSPGGFNLAIPLHRGQLSFREVINAERLTRPIADDDRLTIDLVDGCSRPASSAAARAEGCLSAEAASRWGMAAQERFDPESRGGTFWACSRPVLSPRSIAITGIWADSGVSEERRWAIDAPQAPSFAAALQRNVLESLAVLVLGQDPTLRFTVLEVGALPLESQQAEPFYQLIDLFPGSRVIGFELEAAVCAAMNEQASEGVHYYPVALGARNECRTLYVTEQPMCCSLYEPNEALLRLYNNFEVAYLKTSSQIETVSLDCFSQEQQLGAIDFIKIDVQGAELDVFRGGLESLQDVLAIVSEVEFLPLYLGQPLFGEVCSFLAGQGLAFHHFLGLAGRTLRPIVVNADLNYATQHFWADALFVRDIQVASAMTSQQLLKLSVLSVLYGSPDLAYFCLALYDQRHQTELAKALLQPPGG